MTQLQMLLTTMPDGTKAFAPQSPYKHVYSTDNRAAYIGYLLLSKDGQVYHAYSPDGLDLNQPVARNAGEDEIQHLQRATKRLQAAYRFLTGSN